MSVWAPRSVAPVAETKLRAGGRLLRRGHRSTRFPAKAVPGAAHRLERRHAKGPVDLLAQVADVDLDDVGPVLIPGLPGVLEQLVLAEHLARMAHEGLEQRVLLGRQVDLRVAPPRLARRRVEAQVADRE